MRTVNFEGKSYTLTQEAYSAGGSVRAGVCELTEWYEAAAVDGEGNEYRVIWDIQDGYDPEVQDEEYACDWENPWWIF